MPRFSKLFLQTILFVVIAAFVSIFVTDLAFVAMGQKAPYFQSFIDKSNYMQVRAKASVKDSLTVYGNIILNGSFISGSNALAKIDSFITTAVVDTTKMTSASLGDVYVVSQYTPAYSAILDTFCVYSARYFSGDSVIVKRAFTSSLPHIVKSGAEFCIVKIDK